MAWENTLKKQDVNAELDRVLNEMDKGINAYKQWEGLYETIKPSVLVEALTKYRDMITNIKSGNPNPNWGARERVQ